MFSFIRQRDGRYVVRTSLRGRHVYREPLLNKGTAFTAAERRRLGVEALLPVREMTIEQQAERTLRLLSRLQDPFEKFLELEQVRDRNEHLFYRVLKDRLVELMPVVYTPTVARAVRLFSTTFRRAHGVWITPEQRGRIVGALRAAVGERHIRLMVLTDNESILGIGDQGAGGIAIANGKIALYCAGAGIHPAETLAVSFDVGTENEDLLAHPSYLGIRARRLRGEAYYSLLDEAVEAIHQVAPGAVLQWEDFRNNNAVTVLERYVDRLPSFNDDIQGTGAIALAGLLVACRATGARLSDHRVVVFGGGAAGYGIARQLASSLRQDGLAPEEADARIAVLDSHGLMVQGNALSAPYKERIAWTEGTAARYGLAAGAGLERVVARFRPTVLIGTSGQPGTFTRRIVEAMLGYAPRPVIMPMSNPNELSEANPADLLEWTHGRALVGAGSPNADVEVAGKRFQIGQGNNVFVFPAVGLAAMIAMPGRIDDDWLTTAAHAVADSVTEEEMAAGMIYPRIARLPGVLTNVAAAIVGHAQGIDRSEALDRVRQSAWEPVYPDFD
jgi:malate dehydrogenase (oxaloacetate-decarboxylating)